VVALTDGEGGYAEEAVAGADHLVVVCRAHPAVSSPPSTPTRHVDVM
jgi:hypothetical protein